MLTVSGVGAVRRVDDDSVGVLELAGAVAREHAAEDDAAKLLFLSLFYF